MRFIGKRRSIGRMECGNVKSIWLQHAQKWSHSSRSRVFWGFLCRCYRSDDCSCVGLSLDGFIKRERAREREREREMASLLAAPSPGGPNAGGGGPSGRGGDPSGRGPSAGGDGSGEPGGGGSDAGGERPQRPVPGCRWRAGRGAGRRGPRRRRQRHPLPRGGIYRTAGGFREGYYGLTMNRVSARWHFQIHNF